MASTKILVVDDNRAVREAIAILVDAEPDLAVCGEAGTMAEALQHGRALQPDLALIDISLKGGDGIELIRELKASAPSMETVAFSLHDEPFYIDAAREAGAQGYVIKSESPAELLACLRAVRDGQTRFPRTGPA